MAQQEIDTYDNNTTYIKDNIVLRQTQQLLWDNDFNHHTDQMTPSKEGHSFLYSCVTQLKVSNATTMAKISLTQWQLTSNIQHQFCQHNQFDSTITHHLVQ